MDTDNLIATTPQSFAAVGASFYFTPETLAVGKEAGLNGFQWYVLGRGGVLGNVDSDVVASAFGYFHPAGLRRVWDGACAIMEPRAAATRYFECVAEHGRSRFGDVDGLDAFNAAAEKLVAAANPAGLALFAGIAAEPRATDTAGLAMQHAAVIREFRGSAHLAAVLASGLTPDVAHFIKRPEMWKPFGYDEDATPTVVDADRDALANAETITDTIVRHAFASLTDSEGDDLAAGIAAMHAALA